ncbi:hypothetical protein HDU76_002232, partial [Blyttiomyces sp. JEL0837]
MPILTNTLNYKSNPFPSQRAAYHKNCAINDDGASAIIGELYSRNTVTMAVGAAVKNALHCVYGTTTPQLSNKVLSIKSGTPVDAINNRTFFAPGMSIAKLINDAKVTSLYGNTYKFDDNADMINDQREVPVIQFETKKSVRYAFDAIVALCSLFTLGLLGYMVANYEMKIFKASSPRFLSVIILGANISYISVWLFSQYPMQDASCVTYGWLKYMGFATVFGSLLLK